MQAPGDKLLRKPVTRVRFQSLVQAQRLVGSPGVYQNRTFNHTSPRIERLEFACAFYHGKDFRVATRVRQQAWCVWELFGFSLQRQVQLVLICVPVPVVPEDDS